MRQTLFSSFSSFVWLYSFLMLSGCSDTPQTGSMLSPGDVEKYIVRAADGSLCLADASDAVCFRLFPEGADTPNAPIIHVYRRKLIYVFYYEDHPIVFVERAMDTTGIRQALTSNNQGALASSGDPVVSDEDPFADDNVNGDDTDNVNDDDTDNVNGDDRVDRDDNGSQIDAHHVVNDGWLIKIYYPAGRQPPAGISTLENSRLKIKINGKRVRAADIVGFTRTTGPRGAGVQFFYPNKSGSISPLTIEVTGLVSDEETVTFQVDPPTENRLAYITSR